MNLATSYVSLISAVILGVTSNSFSKIALLLKSITINVVTKLINNTKVKKYDWSKALVKNMG